MKVHYTAIVNANKALDIISAMVMDLLDDMMFVFHLKMI
jgi:hypothetical protein